MFSASTFNTDLSPVFEIETYTNTKIWQNKKSQRKNSKASNVPSNSSSSFLLPRILRRINDERMKTTYQHDFGYFNEYSSVDYDNLMITTGFKERYSHGKKLQEKIKCRPIPKLPYLHGHEIPGRVRKKNLLPEINGDENRLSTQSAPTDSKNRYNLLNEPGMLKPVKITKLTKKQNGNSLIDEDDNNRNLNDNDEQEEVKAKLINNISSGVRNGLDAEDSEKLVIEHRHIKLRPSIDEKTGEISENLPSSSWVSEYQDTIGGTADKILKIRLHSYKRWKIINDTKAK